MTNFLLIDFGATRIKAALLKDGELTGISNYSSIKPCKTEDKKFEISHIEIKNKFLGIINSYYKKNSFDGVLICSEMHGFMVVDEKNDPKTNYISWKDERSTIGNLSDFDKLSLKIKDSFFEKTGMKVRACYPIFNLYSMVQNGEIKNGKIITLPDWLACAGGKSTNKTHITMAAGLGFYNIYTNSWDKDLIEMIDAEISFNDVVKDIEIGGYIEIEGKNIPIYTGVGDHQCALFGADIDKNSISINLGTGSQVGMINQNNLQCEKRPYFNGDMLSVITHIPSGRMLNCFIHFLETINPNIDVWKELGEITSDEIKNADLDMDLTIFNSAWNYKGSGAIKKIEENNFTKKNYLASLLKNYIMQYKFAIESLKPSNSYNKIILSGGIPAKLPIIKEYLGGIINIETKKYTISYTQTAYDETLEGLKKIASKIKSEN